MLPNAMYAYLCKQYCELLPLTLYLDTFIPKNTSIKEEVITMLEYCDHMDIDRLGELGGLYKKYQSLLSPNWIFFVDLFNLRDFQPAPPPDKIAEAVEEWVSEHPKHELKGCNFYALHRYGVKVFLNSITNTFSKPEITIEAFLKDPMYWATPGSSDTQKLKYLDIITGRNRAARRSKWASACHLSLKQLLTLFYDDSEQVLTTAPKRELKKARMIISGDMRNYLRMSYVSYYLEDRLRNHPNTTLFHSKKQSLLMWLNMLSGTNPELNEPGVNVTLDESKFDHNVDSTMLRDMLEEIRDFIIEDEVLSDAYKAELLIAMAKIIKSIVHNGYIEVKFPTYVKRIQVKNGILSGWRWTALLDTISNAAKVFAFRAVTMSRAGGIAYDRLNPITKFTSQGDDLKARSPSYYHAQLFCQLYAEAGFDVHPLKFFISPVADEFLRKVAIEGKILTGYPARSISALLFSNPARSIMKEGEERLRETLNNWLLCMRRCATPFLQMRRSMLQDAAREMKLKKDDILKFLHSPAPFGGMGLEPTNSLETQVIKAKITYHVFIPRIPLLKEINYTEIEEAELMKQYKKGVDWGKAKRTVEPFRLAFSPISPIRVSSMSTPVLPAVYKPALHIHPVFKSNINPSKIWVTKELIKNARRQQILPLAEQVMEPESLATLHKLISSSNMKIIKDWCNGDILGSPPVSLTNGNIITSPLYYSLAEEKVAVAMSGGKISFNLIKRAQTYAAETMHLSLAGYPIHITD